MQKIVSLIAGAAMFALAGTAYAAQPLQLSSRQMDSVTGGGVSIANAAALALGDFTAETGTQTSTNLSLVTPQIAVGQAYSQALAGSLLFQAAAVSHADTAASLP